MSNNSKPFRILSLDGGGSKGVYTLGALAEMEQLAERPMHECFDLIYGTSTGSIIAAALSIGMQAKDILAFYRDRVPSVMKKFRRDSRSKFLRTALREVFGDRTFASCLSGLGVVTTNFDDKKAMIFKASTKMAHGLKSSFQPGFGCTIADAVEASCSAYPFFPIKTIQTKNQGTVRLVDGGFVANNPALFAYADALKAADIDPANIEVLSVGTGNFPERFPKEAFLQGIWLLSARKLISTQLSASANSISDVFRILSRGSAVVRINDAFSDPELASSLFEYDLRRLDRLYVKGRESFAKCEKEVAQLLRPVT